MHIEIEDAVPDCWRGEDMENGLFGYLDSSEHPQLALFHFPSQTKFEVVFHHVTVTTYSVASLDKGMVERAYLVSLGVVWPSGSEQGFMLVYCKIFFLDFSRHIWEAHIT